MKLCPNCQTEHPDEHITCPEDGAMLIEVRELAPGHTVRGKYRIVRTLGHGGMGIVYLADHLLLPRQAALKFLAYELSANPVFLKRFRLEATATFGLRDTNVAEMYDLDQSEDGSLYMAMEFVDGSNLREMIETAGGRLPVTRSLELITDIARGLKAAHGHGVVHRDIKPENVLVCRSGGNAKIVDFGLATITEMAGQLSRTRGLMLTPDYASPEQWRGTPAGELDGRTDLYALGCMAYELLTGKLPLQAQNMEGWMYQHLNVAPAPFPASSELASYPGLEAMTLRLLAKDRDQRTPSAAALLSEMQVVMAKHTAGLERPATPPPFVRAKTVVQDVPVAPPPPSRPIVAAPVVAAPVEARGGVPVARPVQVARVAPGAPTRTGLYAGIGLFAVLAAGAGSYLALHKSEPASVADGGASKPDAGPVAGGTVPAAPGSGANVSPVVKTSTKLPVGTTPVEPQPSPVTPAPVKPAPATPGGSNPAPLPVNKLPVPVVTPSTPDSHKVDPAPSEPSYTGPKTGALHYSGPPVQPGGTVVFNNLPSPMLRLNFNRMEWQPRFTRQPDGGQTLTLRSMAKEPQTQCEVSWAVVQ